MVTHRAKRLAASNADQKIRRLFDIWNDEEKDEKKPSSTKMQHPNVQPINTSTTQKPFFETEELTKEALVESEIVKMQQVREEHFRRRAARMIHSSHKLELSRRMSYIVSQTSSPRHSPIKGIKLSPHFQHSKIVEITRDTRKAFAIIYIK